MQQEASLPAKPSCNLCKDSGIIIIGQGDATFVQKCGCGCMNGRDYMAEMGLFAAAIIFMGLLAILLAL
ncbi:hypothetical protein [Sphingopyxis sp. GC21]|uniref:hypothetical protein n=1 Tax=Sphingopyxis sp. GC21 TaxID=2933562 RepID=UPI0021E3DCF1|nr:hypothetical protein [Sphingopyxis sp. GC21]